MKQKLTPQEICCIAGISIQWFRVLESKGTISEADDKTRRPFQWNVDNPSLLKYLFEEKGISPEKLQEYLDSK